MASNSDHGCSDRPPTRSRNAVSRDGSLGCRPCWRLDPMMDSPNTSVSTSVRGLASGKEGGQHYQREGADHGVPRLRARHEQQQHEQDQRAERLEGEASDVGEGAAVQRARHCRHTGREAEDDELRDPDGGAARLQCDRGLPQAAEQTPEPHALQQDQEQRARGDDGEDQVVVAEVGVQAEGLRDEASADPPCSGRTSARCCRTSPPRSGRRRTWRVRGGCPRAGWRGARSARRWGW